MRNRIRAAIACLRGRPVVVNTHTTGIHFTREMPKGTVIANNHMVRGPGGYEPPVRT